MVTDFPAAPGRAPHDPPAGPAGGSDEPSESAAEMVSRTELVKVIAERQAAKARARKAEAELASLRKRLTDAGVASPAPIDEAQPNALGHRAGRHGDAEGGAMCNGAATSKNGVETPGPFAGSPGRSASGSQRSASDPPAPADAGTELAELRRKLHSRDEQLAGILRDRDLREAAVAAGAVNPDQVVALLRPRVAMRQTPDGQFAPEFLDEAGRPLLDDDGPVERVDVFVTRFLSQPGNANLVRAGAAPGSGAKPGGAAVDGEVRPRTLTAFHRLPPDQRRAVAMAMTRQEREALLGLAHPAGAGFLSP